MIDTTYFISLLVKNIPVCKYNYTMCKGVTQWHQQNGGNTASEWGKGRPSHFVIGKVDVVRPFEAGFFKPPSFASSCPSSSFPFVISSILLLFVSRCCHVSLTPCACVFAQGQADCSTNHHFAGVLFTDYYFHFYRRCGNSQTPAWRAHLCVWINWPRWTLYLERFDEKTQQSPKLIYEC